MEYLNERIVLLAQVAHTRGLIDRQADAQQGYLLALLDQQEAALSEYDEQPKAKLSQE